MRFANKRVLVTGGTSGMGLAGARRILAERGRVIATGRDAGRIEAARAGLGDRALVVANDAADPDGVEALAELVRSAGGLDGLWLNAAVAALDAPEDLDASGFDAMMAANVRGPALQLAKLSPLLNAGASVVVTASSSVYEGAAATGLYAATKGALVAFARSWARALAPRGTRVNTLVPGPIRRTCAPACRRTCAKASSVSFWIRCRSGVRGRRRRQPPSPCSSCPTMRPSSPAANMPWTAVW